jgi:selenocysteine-specific elongation factor
MATGLVVGTAGHIDHGKTSLVRSLTGVDLDALPEEQERGITIALGFTSLELSDGRRAALVDVPGHERLVRTMIAGATGLDAVLLCVSAVDGAMPQTREHLAILDLLGVTQGAVVLTMADLVDEELLELAVEDVAGVVAGTFLEGAPIIATSAITETGLAELTSVMASFESSARLDAGAFRLPVDRAFTRSGFGTVVTGTSWSGALDDGATVRLLGRSASGACRSMEKR